MFQNETSGTTTVTQSMRLVRQRAQACDRDEKRYLRLQGVEHKIAIADVDHSEQLAEVGAAPFSTSSSSPRPVAIAAGSTPVYSVSSPEYDAPRLARRPRNVPLSASVSGSVSGSSGMRPGGFISVTTGRARRTKRYR